MTVVIYNDDFTSCMIKISSILTNVNIEYNVISFTQCDSRKKICIVLCELARSALWNLTLNEYESARRIFLENNEILWMTESALF